MKKLMLAGAISAAVVAGMAAAANAPYSAVGVVQQADPAARTVMVSHEPVQSLNWPAMTMQFAVPEPALFERLPAGRQVAFEFVSQDVGWRIVNAIPLAEPRSVPLPGSPQHGMHGGGMMGDMTAMHQMCMNMMGQMGGRNR